jgi:hypothetical protein
VIRWVKFTPDSTGTKAAPRSVATMMTSEQLTARATARRLGVRRSTLRAWNDCGVGPLPDDRGHYSADAVDAWVGEMSAAPTIQVPGGTQQR